MKQIEIKGKNYNIKYTIRALFLFEQITKKPFKIETLLDNYVFFYSMILANNKDDIISWDDFIDALDEDPTLFKRLAEIVDKQEKKDNLFSDEEESKEGEQKKS